MISILDKIIAESKSVLTEIMIFKVRFFPIADLILTLKLLVLSATKKSGAFSNVYVANQLHCFLRIDKFSSI